MADSRDKKPGPGDRQLDLPLKPRGKLPEGPARPAPRPAEPPRFRVIQGEGKGRQETLKSRDDVVRLMVASAADMLLKRISTERMHDIQKRVDRILRLFERGNDPVTLSLLRRELDDLESIWREGQRKRQP